MVNWSIVTSWISVSFLIVAFYFLAMPSVNLFSFHAKIHQQIEDARSGEQWPPQPLPPVVADVQSLGFDFVANLYLPKANSNTENLVWMLTHPTQRDYANFGVVRSKTGNAEITTTVLEFVTRYKTGEVFVTQNASVPMIFPLTPKKTRTQVPSVTDPARLYAIHRWRNG